MNASKENLEIVMRSALMAKARIEKSGAAINLTAMGRDLDTLISQLQHLVSEAEMVKQIAFNERKITQVTGDGEGDVYALCNDHTLWKFFSHSDEWVLIKPVKEEKTQ